MREMRNAHGVSVGKLQGRYQFKYLGMGGQVTLNGC
jgi:hypothetical protein